MPASVNPQLNAWADERVRTIADKLIQLKYVIDAYVSEYTTKGIAAAITADGVANLFGQQDSRTPITGTQIINQRAGLVQLQTAINTTLISGVGATNAAVNEPIQVNGTPR